MTVDAQVLSIKESELTCCFNFGLRIKSTKTCVGLLRTENRGWKLGLVRALVELIHELLGIRAGFRL